MKFKLLHRIKENEHFHRGLNKCEAFFIPEVTSLSDLRSGFVSRLVTYTLYLPFPRSTLRLHLRFFLGYNRKIRIVSKWVSLTVIFGAVHILRSARDLKESREFKKLFLDNRFVLKEITYSI